MAVDSSAHRAYISDVGDTVSVIDTQMNALVATIQLGTSPEGVAVDPSSGRAYVATFANTIKVIDESTNSVVDTVPVGNRPFGVAVNSAAKTMYTANALSSDVSVIDGTTNTVVATVPVGSSSDYLQAIGASNGTTPASERAYVTALYNSDLTVIGDTSATPASTSISSATALPPPMPTSTPVAAGPTVRGNTDPGIGNAKATDPQRGWLVALVGITAAALIVLIIGGFWLRARRVRRS